MTMTHDFNRRRTARPDRSMEMLGYVMWFCLVIVWALVGSLSFS